MFASRVGPALPHDLTVMLRHAPWRKRSTLSVARVA